MHIVCGGGPTALGKCVTNPGNKYAGADSDVADHALQRHRTETTGLPQVASYPSGRARRIHASLPEGQELRSVSWSSSIRRGTEWPRGDGSRRSSIYLFVVATGRINDRLRTASRGFTNRLPRRYVALGDWRERTPTTPRSECRSRLRVVQCCVSRADAQRNSVTQPLAK